MAVPKKRTSKSRKKKRNVVWKQKVEKQTTKILSLANSFLKKLSDR